MQRIEILSAEVQVKSGESTKTGKKYEIREQAAALHDTRNKYPQACRWQLNRDQQPYAPGLYDIDSALEVGSFERVQFSRGVVLVPVKTATAAKAA